MAGLTWYTHVHAHTHTNAQTRPRAHLPLPTQFCINPIYGIKSWRMFHFFILIPALPPSPRALSWQEKSGDKINSLVLTRYLINSNFCMSLEHAQLRRNTEWLFTESQQEEVHEGAKMSGGWEYRDGGEIRWRWKKQIRMIRRRQVRQIKRQACGKLHRWRRIKTRRDWLWSTKANGTQAYPTSRAERWSQYWGAKTAVS